MNTPATTNHPRKIDGSVGGAADVDAVAIRERYGRPELVSKRVAEAPLAELRAAIAGGELQPGERLPPARQLADRLDVNVHTVLRATQTLRDEGLLGIRRGRGTAVTGVAPRLAAFGELAERLVNEARRGGLDDREIVRLVEARL
jgi:DNA-binding transcriptional regulator YhcF (GntR family)